MKEKIYRVLSKCSNYVSPAILATALVAAISGYLLFISPISGLADNGSFYQVLNSNGIYRLSSEYGQYNDFVISKFGITQYFNEGRILIWTSQNIYIQLALFLNKLFYSHTIFDIRFMGLIYYAFYLGGIYLLTKSLTAPLRQWKSYLIAIIVVFIFADSAFTLYFNSFYTEAAILIPMLYVSGSIISLARDVYFKKWSIVLIFFFSAVMVITVKQQNALLALGLALIALGIMFLPNIKSQKIAIIWGIGFLLFSGIVIYKSVNEDILNANSFQKFSHGTLIENDDPTKKIERNGINGQFALLEGEDYYPRNYTTISPSSEYMQKELIDKTGIGWNIRYYFSNLKQFNILLNMAAQSVTTIQPEEIGNLTRESGRKTKTKINFFTGYSSYLGSFFPGKYDFDILIAIGLVSVYSVGFYMDMKSKRYSGIIKFFFVVGLMSIVVFVPIVNVVCIGNTDLVRNLFIVPVSLSMTFLLFVSDIINHTLWNNEDEDN